MHRRSVSDLGARNAARPLRTRNGGPSVSSYRPSEVPRPPVSPDRLPAGRNVPNDCNVIIEIPMRGDPIKYEVDKETGAVFVDRFMATAMHYPCNYGYIPRTLSEGGAPR